MYISYHCPKCDKQFIKIGAIVTKENTLICPHCDNKKNILTSAEYCEAHHEEIEKKNAKKKG
jgi:DNA-directed RNA polymerase subunit RPC12/RpoP